MTRLILFVFYDPFGHVDDYVIEILKQLRLCCDKLVVICNGMIDAGGEHLIRPYTDGLLRRPNHGYDAAAFKECLVKYLGWETVEQYDELVLMNDTFYGPINDSFSHIFGKMEARNDIDFWGLSCGYKQLDLSGTYMPGRIPEHIQSFFTAFRKTVLCSRVFHRFWQNYDSEPDDFYYTVANYELALTSLLSKKGFRWDTYSDTEKLKSKRLRENYNIYGFNSYELMRYHNFPFVKRKIFDQDPLDLLALRDLEDAADTLKYIHEESDYDAGLIWQNLLRRYNTMSLYWSLHLSYILPSMRIEGNSISEAALVYYCSNPDCIPQMARSAAQNAYGIDVYFILDCRCGNGDASFLSEKGVQMIESKGTGQCMSGFALACRELSLKYSFLGFIHDENNPEHDSMPIFESVTYNYIQNIANDTSYISQVLSLFEKNPRLGVLAAPMPIHNKYISNLADSWKDYFPVVQKLAKEIGLSCRMEPSIPPLMVSGAFWCRTDAIRDIWRREWTPKDFRPSWLNYTCAMNEAMKRILPFSAQSRGFYSGILMHINYASVRLVSEEYMLRIIEEGKSLPFSNSGKFRNLFREGRSYTETDDDGNKTVYRDLGVRGAVGIYIKKHLPEKPASFIINTFKLL